MNLFLLALFIWLLFTIPWLGTLVLAVLSIMFITGLVEHIFKKLFKSNSDTMFQHKGEL